MESSVGSSEEARRARIEWRLSGVLSYEAACNEMQERAMALVSQQRDEAGGGGRLSVSLAAVSLAVSVVIGASSDDLDRSLRQKCRCVGGQ